MDVSNAGINPDDDSQHTRRNLHNWVDDGTLSDYISEIKSGEDRPDL